MSAIKTPNKDNIAISDQLNDFSSDHFSTSDQVESFGAHAQCLKNRAEGDILCRAYAFPNMLVFRAGHFRYFFIFSIIKNDFVALFIKLITYFCTSPI